MLPANQCSTLSNWVIPGVGMTIIDGIVRSGRSRNTPPAQRIPEQIL